MADPVIETLRARVRALKQYVTTSHEVPIRRTSTRTEFKACVDDYFGQSRSGLRQMLGESRELKNLDESMRHLLKLSQAKSPASSYRAEPLLPPPRLPPLGAVPLPPEDFVPPLRPALPSPCSARPDASAR